MRVYRIVRSVLLAAILALCFVQPALGGGITINRESTVVSGGVDKTFKPDSMITIRAQANIYQFGADKFGYIVFALTPRTSGGKLTSAALKAGSIFLAPMGKEDRDGPLPLEVRFRAPQTPGGYNVYYALVPIFRTTPIQSVSFTKMLRNAVAFDPGAGAKAAILKEVGPSLMTHLTNIQVSGADIVPTLLTPPLYLRVAGKSPNEVPVTGGVKERPLEVSWFVGPEYRRTGGYYLFRYKLYPVDDGWSAWTRETAVKYTFLQKGYHELSVQARHVLGDTNLDSREARISFSLSAPLLSPTLKGSGSEGDELQAVDFKSLYPKSRALLVGVWQFDDKISFPSFDGKKIQTDIDIMESALASNGFLDIEKLVHPRLTKNEIDDAIAKFMNRATKGDRLVIYFSTHGFSDPDHPSVGYLATSDCEQALPTSRCVPLSSLRDHASRALSDKTNPAKQVLIAVDSCFAGLGVMAKASTAQAPNLSRLAAESGAYMITAGMADQKAEISSVYGGSTFTHFLANGLKGDADIMKGGVITLSELLIFVQYEVARATESRQIPMMGRIAGGGEMLFAPAAASLRGLSGN